MSIHPPGSIHCPPLSIRRRTGAIAGPDFAVARVQDIDACHAPLVTPVADLAAWACRGMDALSIAADLSDAEEQVVLATLARRLSTPDEIDEILMERVLTRELAARPGECVPIRRELFLHWSGGDDSSDVAWLEVLRSK